MRKIPHVLLILLALTAMLVPVRAELSDDQKRKMFLEAREDIHPVPKPSPSATPKPRPQPAATATPKPRQSPTPEPERPGKPEPTPKPAPEKPAEPRQTPAPQSEDYITLPHEEKPAPPPKVDTPRPTHVPAATPSMQVQIPSEKTPAGTKLDAPISIEKSGFEQDQGYEPPPKQAFAGLFKRWKYLTPGVRRAIDQAKVRKGRWKYIIVHNSGTRQGNARIFDVYHRRVRKMPNGLAYHFVIGNGSSSGDGEIEIGNRWTRQINGGHVASDYLNDISIGICLVGDLNRDRPTKAQLAALDELINYLRGRVGRIKGKQAAVCGHKEINPKPTDCPGDRFPLQWLHDRFR